MPSTRDIRRRIKSVKNTRQITKAMELVAASKMGKAQHAAVAGAPFALLLAQILDAISYQLGEEVTHPLLSRRQVRTRGILLISTDKGLCGALNSNLFRAVNEVKGPAKFVSMGRKGTQYLARTKRQLVAEFPLHDKVALREIRPVADFLVKAFLAGDVDSVEIIYAQFVNTLTQAPVRVSVLPLGDLSEIIAKLRNIGARSAHAMAEDGLRRDAREMLFEPDPGSLLGVLLPMFITGEIYQFTLSAKASEHSARMVAMKTAKDNATDLIGDLTLEYNKARQAAITGEILEIAAATAAQSN
jgi:F-type H+-transporting ATPase subunit gamma